MNFAKLFATQPFCLSFEFFPPKTDEGLVSLLDHARRLNVFAPAFMTCTYGAGGSTRSKTLDVTTALKQECHVPVASHLTCVGSTRDDLRRYLSQAADAGIDNIVALRGDPPRGETSFRPVPDGLQFANELVTLIRDEFPQFGIAVGGYPETHQEAPDPATDLANLKRKVDAGSDVIITQLFYDNADFFSFRDRCRQAGIDIPIVPGILPITGLAQIERISRMCGAKLPSQLATKLADHDDDDWQYRVGIDHAICQTRELVAQGVPGLHFYVLNKSTAASEILSAVDMQGAAS